MTDDGVRAYVLGYMHLICECGSSGSRCRSSANTYDEYMCWLRHILESRFSAI